MTIKEYWEKMIPNPIKQPSQKVFDLMDEFERRLLEVITNEYQK